MFQPVSVETGHWPNADTNIHLLWQVLRKMYVKCRQLAKLFSPERIRHDGKGFCANVQVAGSRKTRDDCPALVHIVEHGSFCFF